jgi:hypothetical protein
MGEVHTHPAVFGNLGGGGVLGGRAAPIASSGTGKRHWRNRGSDP